MFCPKKEIRESIRIYSESRSYESPTNRSCHGIFLNGLYELNWVRREYCERITAKSHSEAGRSVEAGKRPQQQLSEELDRHSGRLGIRRYSSRFLRKISLIDLYATNMYFWVCFHPLAKSRGLLARIR